MSPEAFNEVSLHTNNQEVILGSVLIPPNDHPAEYGIELVGQDPYPPERAGQLLEAVSASVVGEGTFQRYYFPTFEQNASAQEYGDYFRQQGFPISSADRWLSGDQCYAQGWAMGRLTYVPPDEIDEAYAGGRLKPSDILLTDAEERGVFRAIKKVYASFYNDNAFLERLRRGVDESEVGMAVLVHHSFPDPSELANGVATFRHWQDEFEFPKIRLVTQWGAQSVTNPDLNAKPEVVDGVIISPLEIDLTVRQPSRLVQLGDHVLEWPGDYKKLIRLLWRVVGEYREQTGAQGEIKLDFEYKKVEPGNLVVKQVRPLPVSLPQPNDTYLIHHPVPFCTWQGETDSDRTVFSYHRLKTRLRLAPGNFKLNPENLSDVLYTEAQFEYIQDGSVALIKGNPTEWPDASHEFKDDRVTDRWSISAGEGRRDFQLTTDWTGLQPVGEGPVITLDSLDPYQLRLTAQYSTPQILWIGNGETNWVTEESVGLVPCMEVRTESLLQERTLIDGGIKIQTRFYWPKGPEGFSAGYTAPLVDWEETRITGLTEDPILLDDYYAQTYGPGHHNFSEAFIFEPGLEPDLPADQLEALAERNIRLIYAKTGDPAEIKLLSQ